MANFLEHSFDPWLQKMCNAVVTEKALDHVNEIVPSRDLCKIDVLLRLFLCWYTCRS